MKAQQHSGLKRGGSNTKNNSKGIPPTSDKEFVYIVTQTDTFKKRILINASDKDHADQQLEVMMEHLDLSQESNTFEGTTRSSSSLK